MKLTPSSTTRRSVAMAWSRLGGSPQIPGPGIRMAPNPGRLTVRSPPTSMVPAAAAVGCASTRYLLLVTVSLSRLPPVRARGEDGGAVGTVPARRGRGPAACAPRGEDWGPRGLVPLLLLGMGGRGRPGGYGHIGR